jgi:hypothetical protein
MITRNPLSSLLSENLILGMGDGAFWASASPNPMAANAVAAKSFTEPPD